VVAILLTMWAIGQFMNFAPVSNLPIWLSVEIDSRVLLATLLLSIVATMLFGMLPAMRTSGIQPMSVLKEEAGSLAGGRSQILSSGLAVAQISLSLVLLACAGLFIRSFRATRQFNPGFDPRGVLLESYDLFPNGYTESDGLAFDRQALEKVRALPGVRTASLSDWVPLGFDRRYTSFLPEGYVPGQQEQIVAGYAHISPDYFSTMRIPLIRGRDFSAADTADSTPVVIVNQALAERYWPRQDSVGKRMRIRGKWRTIVGVARTTNYYDLNEPPQPFFYFPLFQSYSSEVVLHVRTAGDPRAAAATVTRVIHQLNAELPVFDVSTLEERIGATTFTLHMAGSFVGVFGLVALLLAAVGLYGVIAYGARQRTHEIGIRLALGAQPGDIRKMVLGRGTKLALVGVGIGLAASFGVTRLVRSLLVGVGAADPATFLVATVLLFAVALAACYLPARRAARVQPVVALRHE
jgi:predicted permease